MTDKKDPWMKFYPSDWRGDPRLRMCSIGARGLWMEMMCIMHEAVPYGHLVVGDVPVTNRQLASLAGISQPECLKFMAELGSAGVYSRQEGTGIIYSRRMVRDHAKSEEGRRHIRKRWPDEGGSSGKPPEPTSPPSRDPNRSPTGDPITSESRSQIYDGADDARATAPINSLAMEVTEKLLVIAGHDLNFWPPGWCGAPMRVQVWLNAGWPRDLIVATARAVIGRKRDGPPSSVKYFENAIAAEVAALAAPVPKMEISDVQAGSNQPSLRLLRSVPSRGGGYAAIIASLETGQSPGDPINGAAPADARSCGGL